MIYDTIIIGAGAAGLFCAASATAAAQTAAKVMPAAAGGIAQSAEPHHTARPKGLILEKTKRAGTKLLMSGGGQCNITHSGSIKDFIDKYGKNGGKVRSCLYKYNNQHLMDFLEENGIPTVIREDGKVFPKSMKAGDIQQMLLRKSAENGFQIKYNAAAKVIRKQNNLWQVDTNQDTYTCKTLIIACGGCSYPTTGSDGSIFPILQRDLDLTVVPTRPALTPIYVEDYPYTQQSGIAFENAGLQVWRRDESTGAERKITQGAGPLLLTHENFSGPIILNFSKDITNNDKVVLNYLYPCEKNRVLEILNTARQKSNLQLSNLLAKEFGLPKSFAAAIISQTGEKTKAIAQKLTEDTYTVTKLGGYKKAMATAGGVSLSEINPKTMECKKHPNLYIIGETLDIDGETGGYNLQFAYASARAAATAALQQ